MIGGKGNVRWLPCNLMSHAGSFVKLSVHRECSCGRCDTFISLQVCVCQVCELKINNAAAKKIVVILLNDDIKCG